MGRIDQAKIVDKIGPKPFVDIHPIAGKKAVFKHDGDLPPFGGSDGLETKFKRCAQCGFILNTFVNQRGSGWGNNIATTAATPATALRDEDTGAGCPLCGASDY